MKRTILTMIAAAGILMSAKAQQTTTGIHFIPRVGVNFTNATVTAYSSDYDYKIKTGFHIGADVEIPIADEFYLQPGLLFSTKGAKAKNTDNGDINLSYIEVPVSFMYKPVLGEGRLILGVGPYVGVGVGGKIKEDGEDDVDVEFKNEVNFEDVFSSEKAYLKRTDFGANFTVGYELAMGVVLQLNAQLGLSNNATKLNNAPSEFDDQKFKNTGFGLSVGYRF
ncbi:outer membrane beta-barrel protein [Flavihumibacter solisilvae]|uniref:Outer membrane protein beta-barrel domain-containing protein n=1 Tax=Flavihumibacter solisilvae TaxID=1349421 RepID=A0A0C1I9P7_9BACT|nr:outer membrane beta-barrel protein [Flavihumibacter solisilvae]KIC90735.1 hypothetical protein OI18_22840 [Flavihumibacter solisilvae]